MNSGSTSCHVSAFDIMNMMTMFTTRLLNSRVLFPILSMNRPAGSINDVATNPPRLMTHAFSDGTAPRPERNSGKSGVTS